MNESETCIIDSSPNPETDSIEIEAEGVLVSAERSSNELDIAQTPATGTAAGQKHFFGRLADSFTHLCNGRKSIRAKRKNLPPKRNSSKKMRKPIKIIYSSFLITMISSSSRRRSFARPRKSESDYRASSHCARQHSRLQQSPCNRRRANVIKR